MVHSRRRFKDFPECSDSFGTRLGRPFGTEGIAWLEEVKAVKQNWKPRMRDNLDPGAEDTKCHLELSVPDHCGRMTTCIKEFSANFQILYFDVSIQEREKKTSISFTSRRTGANRCNRTIYQAWFRSRRTAYPLEDRTCPRHLYSLWLQPNWQFSLWFFDRKQQHIVDRLMPFWKIPYSTSVVNTRGNSSETCVRSCHSSMSTSTTSGLRNAFVSKARHLSGRGAKRTCPRL